ncbi:G protein-coupled glucose receptor regulating Gpa2 [Rhizoctonia solani]|uniref:G protein-coupled glucose receptor regulating Gpa2 n=1 Tax=Rhizoctonia solani TaxID=456999 RepID=A0A8H7HED2_9AGAM|nr:G protein-coupled glucose receptor regulating Gpa2 [Rhizoctonia solani]
MMDDYGDVSFGYEADYGLPGNRVGLALIGAMGLISALSTLVLIGYIMVGYLVKDHDQPMVQGIRSFTHSALGVFLCSLLISDMIQGAAFAINFKWAADGSVHSGLACTAQGAVSQFGDLGSALWSLAISMHTFSLLFLVQKPPVWLTWMIFIVGWVLIAVLPILGPYGIQKLETKGEFYGVSGAWCWIGHGYQLERFLYVYMWIFLSLVTSLILYGLVYLRFSGRLVLKKGRFHWSSKPTGWSSGLFSSGVHEPTATSRPYSTFQSHSPSQRMTESEKNGIGKHLKSISKRLMLYPLVYSVVTLPVAACRIGAVSGWKPPLPMYIFAGISFTSSGLTNVILFIVTRHALLRKVVSVRPQIHVTTHQVTVLEDARGVQTIHLPRLGKPSEDRESNSDNSVSEELDESFGMSKKYESVPAGSAPPSPNPAGNASTTRLS